LLGNRRKIRFANGVEVTTPLVIPAISTRNVGRIEREGEYGDQEMPVSYASMVLELLAPQLDKALLVSAYDLHYRALHDSERLLEGAENTVFENPNFLMIDSGLYETRQRVGYDDGYEEPRRWGFEDYEALLGQLPESLPAAIVNYDLNADQVEDRDQISYEAQLQRAREFFASQPDRFVSVCLLKPERPRGFIDPNRLTPHAAELREFDVVAVTEKELGDTLRDRFAHLAELRSVLDRQSVDAPIHVFGGLDPLLTPIYIACGAEIVDGVGWLRYSYSSTDDTANYLESRPITEVELDMRVPNRLFRTFTDNLTYLHSLRNRLELLLESGDWAAFSEARGASLEQCVATIFSNLEVT
jgi:hypothetical protein